ncbi:hypothetical protein EMPS_08672 [Entomortierella parvispora]|uniref:Uncharacterized protein n=1 Tax=Entomortierella parvispora TaxID=205924 RepID=A0A9P3LZL7_9FUNG|nr:hypothetical protein EMPS_08672 [Entomortierella parvispora]
MYEDPVAQSFDSHGHFPYRHHHPSSNINPASPSSSSSLGHYQGQQDVNQQPSQDPEDQALSRLHQHQLLIQLRLEVNALKTQISQLELLKQQLVQQQSMMPEAEFAQMMDQFSRTSVSLLTVGQPTSHFGDQHSIGGGGGGGGGSLGGGIGMPMMERLQEKLRSMTIQQSKQQQLQYQQQQFNLLELGSDPATATGPSATVRRDPVRMEQLSIEEDLRDLERRMRSIQLIR